MQFCLYVIQIFFDAISAPLSGVSLCMWHNEMPSDITPSVTGACLRFNDSAHRFEIILHIVFFFQQFFFLLSHVLTFLKIFFFTISRVP